MPGPGLAGVTWHVALLPREQKATVPGQPAVQPRRGAARLIGMRMVRVVAAVVSVAALTACQGSPASVPASVPAGVSLPLPGGMPGYYVVVAGLEITVRASDDGHVTGSVAIPGPAGNARSIDRKSVV